MNKFYAFMMNFNTKKLEWIDVIEHLVYVRSKYESSKDFKDYKQLKKFCELWLKERFMSRCEYEVLISPWPPEKDGIKESDTIKIDIWEQIEPNIDIVVELFQREIGNKMK